jgi:hypothetical protein
MTPAQRKALRPYRKRLRQALADAAAAATTPGKSRTWFVPYLAAVLETYQELTTKLVDGKALSKAVAKDPRTAFFKLLKLSKRDPKTRSRWAAALAHAYDSGISPERLAKWLKKGGGVAGRAAELANVARAQRQIAKPSRAGINDASIRQPSPEANDLVTEATNNSNGQS